jgi:tetratricopeptide (TPR) repeat protein
LFDNKKGEYMKKNVLVMLVLVCLSGCATGQKMSSLSPGMTKQEDGKTIEDCNKAIPLDPNLARAYVERGNAYDDKGQHDRAIEDYNKVIALNPNDVNAYTNRGLAYERKSDMDSAISNFKKACEMGYEDGCKNLQMALKKR